MCFHQGQGEDGQDRNSTLLGGADDGQLPIEIISTLPGGADDGQLPNEITTGGALLRVPGSYNEYHSQVERTGLASNDRGG